MEATNFCRSLLLSTTILNDKFNLYNGQNTDNEFTVNQLLLGHRPF